MHVHCTEGCPLTQLIFFPGWLGLQSSAWQTLGVVLACSDIGQKYTLAEHPPSAFDKNITLTPSYRLSMVGSYLLLGRAVT